MIEAVKTGHCRLSTAPGSQGPRSGAGSAPPHSKPNTHYWGRPTTSVLSLITFQRGESKADPCGPLSEFEYRIVVAEVTICCSRLFGLGLGTG